MTLIFTNLTPIEGDGTISYEQKGRVTVEIDKVESSEPFYFEGEIAFDEHYGDVKVGVAIDASDLAIALLEGADQEFYENFIHFAKRDGFEPVLAGLRNALGITLTNELANELATTRAQLTAIRSNLGLPDNYVFTEKE